MTGSGRPLARARRWLRAFWGNRPALYSRPLWALLIVLDLLPWPLGEDLLAGLFAAVALVRPSRRRRALAWARQQPGASVWRLALSVSAFRGRWVARSSLLGLRGPDDLRRQVVVRGEEHLVPAARGTILLGFHLGPPNVDVALRVLGHRLAWLGTRRSARAWSREAWRPLRDPRENLAPPAASGFWPGYLHRARRTLLDGGTLFILADSWVGRESFRVVLPGSSAVIRSGWLTLWRHTGARVLPVSTHLAGRTQVITIHPALPAPGADDVDEFGRWREILSALMTDHVQRVPEQCPALVFPPRLRPRPGAGARPIAAEPGA